MRSTYYIISMPSSLYIRWYEMFPDKDLTEFESFVEDLVASELDYYDKSGPKEP